MIYRNMIVGILALLACTGAAQAGMLQHNYWNKYLLTAQHPNGWSARWDDQGNGYGTWVVTSSGNTIVLMFQINNADGSLDQMAASFAHDFGAPPPLKVSATQISKYFGSLYSTHLMGGPNKTIPMTMTLRVVMLSEGYAAFLAETTTDGLPAADIAAADQSLASVRITP